MKSLASYPLQDIRLANSTNVNVNFVYNFSTKDEGTFDILKKSQKMPNGEYLQNIFNSYTTDILDDSSESGAVSIGSFPRYNLVEIEEPVNQNNLETKTAHGFLSDALANDKVIYPFNVQSENNPFTFLNLHDDDVQVRIINNFRDVRDYKNISLKEKDEFTSAILRSLVDEKFVSLNEDGRTYSNTFFDRLSKVSEFCGINDSIVTKLVVSASLDPSVQFNMEATKNILKNLRITPDTNPGSISNYQIIFDSKKSLEVKGLLPEGVTSFKNLPDSANQITAGFVGYVIRKSELSENANDVMTVNKSVLIAVDSKDAKTSLIDTNIAHDKKYAYSFQKAYLTAVWTGDQNYSYFIILGPTRQAAFVKTANDLPPQPPADIDFVWDYGNSKLALNWNFPFDNKGDISAFQIFRRSSLEDAFTLIAQLNFGDIKDPQELPGEDAIFNFTATKNPNNVPTFFYDEDFKKESNYIYAMCCINKLGYTSCYSDQHQISFDKYKNSLIKKFISQEGAPKQYPNFYIKNEKFLQFLNVSGKRNAKIYFNPDVYYLAHDVDDVCSVVKTEDVIKMSTSNNLENRYQIQLMNLDLQVQKVISTNVILNSNKLS